MTTVFMTSIDIPSYYPSNPSNRIKGPPTYIRTSVISYFFTAAIAPEKFFPRCKSIRMFSFDNTVNV